MVGKNNKQIKNTKQGIKVESYSIKKFKVGAASVVIGASIFFGAGVAAAADTQENSVDTNTTSEKTDAVAAEEAPAAVAQPATENKEVAKEATTEEVAKAVEEKVATTEEVKVDATKLTNFIKELEKNIEDGTYDNRTEDSIKALKEEIAKAKITAETSKDQATIDATLEKLEKSVEALPVKEVKEEAKAEATAPKAEAKEETTTTDAKAEVVEAKKELDHLVAEGQAWTPAVTKEATKVEDATAKSNLEAAVAKVNTKVAEALNVIANNEAKKDDVKTKSSELRAALEAVQVARVRAGYTEASAAAVLDNTEYTVGNPSVIDAGDRMGNSGTVTDSSHAMSNNTLIVDGTSVANPTGQAVAEGGSSTLAEAVKKTYTGVKFSDSTPISQAPGLILYGQNYGNDDKGANGRDDYPVSKDEFDKINAEKELWRGQPSASGWSTNTTTTGSGSTYEYLATEIYGYAYEQGEEVAITNYSKRFDLSEEAKAAGWKILGVFPTNLPNGLTYDSKTDTISGKISSSLENGVYDNRTNVYVTNGTTTVRYFLANYAVGWIGWKDTTAPTTVTTDDITNVGATLNTNIHFNDNAAPATNTASGTNSKTVTTRADGSITVEAPAWRSVAETSVLGADQINGVSYSTTTGNLTGTASTAGIYTVTAQVKDYADTPGNEWTQSGQESHESFTITVRPGVTIGNVVAGATEVPITVSDGATQITVTLPDGTTVEAAKDSSGNWLVTGGTSSTATKGTNIGSGTSIKTPVNASSTTVGVDNISAVVAAENVSATLLTNTITLTTAQGETVVASFNKESGRWIINSVNGATVTTVDEAEKANDIAEQWVFVKDGNKGRISYRVENTDDTYSVRNLEIVSDLAATNNRGSSTGQNSYRVFEFTQTYDANGNVTAASSKRSDAQTVNTAVVVTYDAATNTWTASDGSTVTATPNVTRYSTTEAASDAWGHGEDGKDYTAIRSASETKVEKDGAGTTVPVYRDTESWTISTSSGVSGVVNRVSNKARDYASVTNTLPTAKGTDYSTDLNSTVNLLDPTKVTTADEEDTTPIVTKVTVTAPDGTVKTFEPTAELAVLNNAKAAVSTAQDAYTQAASDLKEAVDARIAADAAATAKNTELATAETTLDAAISEYKIAKAMVDKGGLTGDALTAAQARLTAAETAQTAAQNTVNTLTTELTTLHNNVATAQATVNTNLAATNTARADLEEKEKELASARAAVATAVNNALNGSDKFKVDQVGKYTVSLSVIDSSSNQVLSDATATGTTTGNDTNSGTVAASDVTADYTITVNPFELVGTSKTSTDIQGATQTGQPTFTFDDASKSEINQGTKVYTLASTEAKDADGKTVGTYAIDATTGVVTFVPNKDFTGTPTPATVTLTVTFGTGDDAVTKSATANYTPTVVPVKPVADKSETTDIQGATQTSDITYNADNNTDNNTTTLNFAKGSAEVNGETKSVELDKKTVQFVDAEGTAVDTLTVENQGTYTLVKDTDGNVTGVKFSPLATFTGKATPVTVQIKDVNGTAVTTTYTPTVTPVTAEGTPATSTDIQGAVQNGTPTFSVSDETNIVKGTDGKPAATYALKGADAEGKVEVKDGDKVLYTYTIDATTGEVTFTPAKDYKGQPTAATVVATYTLATADEADTTTTPITAEATYTPTIVTVAPTAEPSVTEGVQGATQTSAISYDKADNDNSTLNFAKGTTTVDGTAKSVELDQTSVKFVDASGKAVDTLTVAGEGTYTLEKDANGNVTGVKFVPNAAFTGQATPVTVQATDANGTPVTTTYTPSVTPVAVVSTDKTSTDVQGVPQSETPTFEVDTDSANVVSVTDRKLVNPENGQSVTSYDVPNVGKYEIDKDGKVTFTPTPSFTGQAPAATVVATVTITNENGETATVPSTATYTPTVTPLTIKGEDAQSTNVQGMTQTGTPTFTSDSEKVKFTGYKLVDPTTGKPTTNTSVTTTEGTYTIDPDTGKVTFVPKPDFVGKGSITVEATTSTGRTTTANYTPETTPITVESTPATSKDIQGKLNPQEGTPKFTLPTDIENTEVKEGTKLAEVTGYTLLDENNNPVYELNKPEGKYTIDAEGKVTFTPVNSYTGTPSPVKVQATVTITNANGEKATITKDAEYTPTVVPVTPTAKESATAGKQGAKQVSPIVFDNTDTNTTTLNFNKGETSEVLDKEGKAKSVELVKESVTLLDANGNPTTTVTVDGQGTYTLVKDSEGNYSIEFQPTPEYSGTATPVRVQVTDLNGSVVETTYTPTVIAEDGSVVVEYIDKDTNLPIVPTETPVNNAKVTTDYTTTPKEIPGYKLVEVKNPTGTTKDENGKVTGKVTDGTTTITYVYEKIKQKATLSYFDVTTGKEVAIASAPSESVEGVTNGAIDFTNKAATIAALEKAGYEVTTDEFQAATTANRLFDNDENVDQNFKVLVKQRVLPVTPTTPNVTPGVPVTPEDPANWPESVKDLQKQLTKTVTRTIKYRYIDENGQEAAKDVVQTVTFTRNATVNLVTGEVVFGDWSAAQTLGEVNSPAIDGYTTTTKSVASATVNADSKDETVFVIYNKVAEKTTSYVDKDGNEISPKEDGTKEAKKVPGYYYTGKTTVDKDGNITHVYAQVTTKFIEEGTNNEVAPEQKGTQPKEDVTGYEYVRTVTDENGNTTHIYKKVTNPNTNVVTKFLEKGTNKELAPQENGKQDPKVIDGYKLIGTEVDPNGNVTHIYEKVQTPATEKVTKFVDENGNPVASEEKGNQPKKEVPGYEFVRTYTDESGNTVHVYKKVTNPTPTPTIDKHTSFVDVDGNEIRPTEEGTQPKKDIPGYEFVETKVDEKGNTIHVYRKVVTPTPTPVNPVTPEKPTTPAKPAVVKEGKQLPNTDASTNNAANTAAGAGLIALIAAAVRRRKNK